MAPIYPSLPPREKKARLSTWLEGWTRAGAALEAERVRRLQGMTDDEAREQMRGLLALWRPTDRDDFGAELVTHQHWFVAAARAARSR
jgi:hypothetical protein